VHKVSAGPFSVDNQIYSCISMGPALSEIAKGSNLHAGHAQGVSNTVCTLLYSTSTVPCHLYAHVQKGKTACLKFKLNGEDASLGTMTLTQVRGHEGVCPMPHCSIQ
jgi:hypothetical protein